MSEVLCGGVIWSESEFLPNEIYFGKCGENMQAMLQSWARQKYRSTQDVFTAMRKAGRCKIDGVSTMGQQQAQAKADGFKVDYLGTDTGMAYSAWEAFLLKHLPDEAVGVEVANGQALRDELTGKGEDASNLKYHLFGIFGHHSGGFSPHAGKNLPKGWWCADGDSYVNNSTFPNGTHNRHQGGHILVFYSDETMRKARPCSALAMYPKAMIPGSGGASVAWSKGNDGVYRDSKGHTAGGAMGDKYLKAETADGLASETYYSSADAFLPLEDGGVISAHKDASGNWGARNDEGAALTLRFYQQTQALKQQLAAAQTQGGGTTDPRAQALLEAVQNAVK